MSTADMTTKNGFGEIDVADLLEPNLDPDWSEPDWSDHNPDYDWPDEGDDEEWWCCPGWLVLPDSLRYSEFDKYEFGAWEYGSVECGVYHPDIPAIFRGEWGEDVVEFSFLTNITRQVEKASP